MITANELYAIGFVRKTHGIKGELNIILDTVYDADGLKFLVFDIDSIFVPFLINSLRTNTADSCLVTLKGIDNVEDAKQFTGKTVFALRSEIKEQNGLEEDDDSENMYLSDLVGYCAYDGKGDKIGDITGFNDDTSNILLEISRPDGQTVLVPFVDDWIENLDREKRAITLWLPEGLID